MEQSSEHVVFHPTAQGEPGFTRVPSLQDGLALVERLRNERGLEDVQVAALTQVPLAFRPYYFVEVAATTAGHGPVAEAAPPAPVAEQGEPAPEPVAEAPAVEVPAVEVPSLEPDAPASLELVQQADAEQPEHAEPAEPAAQAEDEHQVEAEDEQVAEQSVDAEVAEHVEEQPPAEDVSPFSAEVPVQPRQSDGFVDARGIGFFA